MASVIDRIRAHWPTVNDFEVTLEANPGSVEAGRFRDYAQADGELGYFQHQFKVYGREGEPCVTPGCGPNLWRCTSSFFGGRWPY